MEQYIYSFKRNDHRESIYLIQIREIAIALSHGNVFLSIIKMTDINQQQKPTPEDIETLMIEIDTPYYEAFLERAEVKLNNYNSYYSRSYNNYKTYSNEHNMYGDEYGGVYNSGYDYEYDGVYNNLNNKYSRYQFPQNYDNSKLYNDKLTHDSKSHYDQTIGSNAKIYRNVNTYGHLEYGDGLLPIKSIPTRDLDTYAKTYHEYSRKHEQYGNATTTNGSTR